ncbi:MAG: segregation ATPase FtsK/SpoIIIE, family [Actinomycetota bacterium]|nr:segregation ATPase FtsK/SpoIIIE, family [Actinomycetota bacterium]
MRLLLTAVPAGGHRGAAPADLAVEVDGETTVADLALRLAEFFGAGPAPALAQPRLRLVGAAPVAGPPAGPVAGPPPSLWIGDRLLDPAERLVTSPVRHGSVVGVGGPLPDVLSEPTGLVEVKVAGGPGAGRVYRLAPGSTAVGSSPQCPLVVDDPWLPPVALWIDVDATGGVTVRPEAGVAPLLRQAPAREHPLPGPIVLARPEVHSPPDTGRRSRRNRRSRRQGPSRSSRPSRWRRWRPDPGAALPHDLVDPGADVPLVHLDRRPLPGPVRWRPGDALVVGGILLELGAVEPADASLSPSPGGATSDYNRPPRLLPPTRDTRFSLPVEPQRPERMPIPVLMVIAPILMSVALYWFTKSPYSLVFAVFSPLMAISNVTSSRRQARLRYREQLETFYERSRSTRQKAFEALSAERAARRRDLPDPAALLLVATGPRSRLWERRDDDPDWLRLRVGTADVASEVTLRDPTREEHEGPQRWTAPDVPVWVDVTQAEVIGVAGPDAARRCLGRWLLAQAAVLHSPGELDVVVLAGPDGDADWSWVRWIPHVRREGADNLAQVGADDATVAARVAELVAVMQARKSIRNDSRTAPAWRPVLVVLDGARRLRLLPGMVTLLQEGPGVGLYFLCLDDDRRRLPEECHAVVVTDGRQARLDLAGQGAVEAIRVDDVPLPWCERVSRALAPIRDVSGEDLAGALPASSRLLDVLGLDPPSSAAIARGWASGGRTTLAVIGEGADGPFAVDIRRDGPHGLIAGTTGSGKSELLQTLIASLAIGNRPDEMTFVLVDYKGGAAFKDCKDLPHTVGMVTDLDGHLTTRALESLGAELRHREHQLASAGAKDIEDYTAARALPGGPAEPMPRLMLVIDEFAALVAELPDFVTGLVDIARRGRSLGVHLLLATQRPAGVVSAEIKSNTTLRIALRVTDPQDSQDVIETSDAAAIAKSLPGRAYARLGHASLTPFQTARVGGRPRGAGPATVGLHDVRWTSLGASTARGPAGGAQDDVSVPTDLAALVREVRTAAGLVRVPPSRSPWLPPLPDTVTLEDARSLVPGFDVPDGGIAPLVIGATDLPAEQRRIPGVFDLERGAHLAVIGGPRTGRSAALRALAGAVAAGTDPRDVHLYGVDCGSNALLPVLAMPHTGAVISRDQPDRLGRLTNRLSAEISRRQQRLAQEGFAGLREHRLATPAARRLPYLLVLLDRWEGFLAAFESLDGGRLVDQWLQILQEGGGVGVVTALTCDRTGLSGRLSTLMDDKIVLRLTDPSDFAAIGLPARQVPEHLPPGRGFRSEGLQETQLALLDPDPSGARQVAALQRLGREATDRAGEVPRDLRPFRVDPLPVTITLSDATALAEAPPGPAELPVAVGGDTLALRYWDAVQHGPGMVVAGPRRSGRSTVLMLMGREALRRGWRVGVVTSRISPLRDLSPGLVGSWTGDDDRQEVTEAIKGLRPRPGDPPSLLLVDDLELVGPDGWLPEAINDHLQSIRDTGSAVVAAGALDELGGMYRGPVVALKRSRSGVLLAPQVPNDGDLFGLRLPRSVIGGGPPGRGILVTAGSWESVQVPWPEGTGRENR